MQAGADELENASMLVSVDVPPVMISPVSPMK